MVKSGGMWIFDNEIESVMGTFENGDLVLVHDFDGYPMGIGFINRNSKIRVRLFSRKEDTVIDEDYELMAYSNTKIDYEYIIHLIQNIVTPDDEAEEITPEERQKKIDEVKQYVEELNKENPKIAQIMSDLITEIEKDEEKYKGQSILHIVEDTKQDCINQVITDFCYRWFASKEDIMYAATHYRNGEIPNESAIRTTVDYASYKKAQEKAIPKFKYYAKLFEELRKILDEEIESLMIS